MVIKEVMAMKDRELYRYLITHVGQAVDRVRKMEHRQWMVTGDETKNRY